MFISKNLPNFESKKALLLVTGAKDVRFYLADEKQIRSVGGFKVEKPNYTDREGFFEAHGQGYGSGSVYEKQKKNDRAELFGGINKNLKELKEEVDALYLFVPQYLKNEVESHLPKSLREKLKYAFAGNFTHQHPFKLLQKIRDQDEEEKKLIQPMKSEAVGIYKKSAQAKRTLRKRTY